MSRRCVAAASATRGVLRAALAVAFAWIVLAPSPAFGAARDDSADDPALETAIMQMPAPSGFAECDALGGSGRLDVLEILTAAGYELSPDQRDQVRAGGIVIYHRVWCDQAGTVLEVRGTSTNQLRAGSQLMQALSAQVGGDEFEVPIDGAIGTSRAVPGGVAHVVAFTRNDRIYGVTALTEDPAGPDIVRAAAVALEPRTGTLATRSDVPSWWDGKLPYVVTLVVITIVVALGVVLMRRNHAADARTRAAAGESTPRGPSDPLGFG